FRFLRRGCGCADQWTHRLRQRRCRYKFPYAKLSVAGQIVGGYYTATTTTGMTASYASTSRLFADGLGCSAGSYLTWAAGQFGCAADVTSAFAYPFPLNATTTGLGIYGSSTIGNGTQVGGLTVNGG